MKGIKQRLFLCSFLLAFSIGIYLGIIKANIQALSAESDTWYYDNLTDEDRKKIRLAMDYAIPRDQIIDEIFFRAAELTATPVASSIWNTNGESINPRPYNKSKSLNLLVEVFGKKYNLEINNESFSTTPYFKMVMITPTSSNDRMQLAILIAQSFKEIGISTTLKYVRWDYFYNSVFNPKRIGVDYKHGGYDAAFFGWPVTPDPDYSFLFYSSAIPPNGENIAFIDNSLVNEIWERALKSPDRNVRLQALKDFQEWFYEAVPMSSICQTGNFLVTDPALEGIDFSGLNYPNYGNWSHSTQDSIRIHSPGAFQNLNPLLTHSYSDSLAIGDNFEGLIGRYWTNFTKYYGFLAESWTHSTDNLIWEFKIKEGIKFSDGSNLTVDDVVFSYKMVLDEEVASKIRDNLLYLESPDNVEKINETSCRFTFSQFYPYVEEYFTIPILSKEQMENIAKGNWYNNSWTNTQYAPVGTGRYMMDKFSTEISLGIVTLTKNPYYDETLRSGTPWVENPSIEKIIIKAYPSIDTAVIALQNDVLDIVDLQADFSTYFTEINGSNWGKIRTTPNNWEALVYNHHSPIWGMNASDPCEMYDIRCPKTIDNGLIFFYLFVILFSILGITQIKKKRENLICSLLISFLPLLISFQHLLIGLLLN
ncbi:MAG: ABC transporter substrate-binding protein [Candidatus Hodarchaeales archaeon]|jgi:ABC-type transport system substrate-binding protein